MTKIHKCPDCGKPVFKGDLQGKIRVQCPRCKQWFIITE